MSTDETSQTLRQEIFHGNCMELMKSTKDNTYTAIISDPPYGISYMGRKWDYNVPSVDMFKEMLRVTKSGGYALIFGGARTFHRMAVNMEDAGWELRDTMMWLYASGFPKSMNISKAIDKDLGLEREVVGRINLAGTGRAASSGVTTAAQDGYEIKRTEMEITKPACEESREWYGYGTSLKPAYEPIIVAMKPLDKSYVNNIRSTGIGGINIDECRIGEDFDRIEYCEEKMKQGNGEIPYFFDIHTLTRGKFPANVMHDGSDECRDIFREHFRAFLCSKPTKEEKERGLENFIGKKGHVVSNRKEGSRGMNNPAAGRRGGHYKNTHPTVKPLDLMRYLATMVKMPNDKSLILDPFCGSGTTVLACKSLGMKAHGFEREEEFVAIARSRIQQPLEGQFEKWTWKKVDKQMKLF
tara:strand:- start:12389 stop:13624 length:1236 start_codon:yes stop_codon:yes gene_type:complete